MNPSHLSFRVVAVTLWWLLLAGLSVGAVAASPLSTSTHHPRPVAATSPSATGAISPTLYLPLIHGPLPAKLVIAAAHVDSAISHEPDEAILLWNSGPGDVSLAGWQLATKSRHAAFPATAALTLPAGARVWCAGTAPVFRMSFGAEPACAWESADDPGILLLEGALTLPNQGGHLLLIDPDGQVADTLVYGQETRPAPGWTGPPAQLYVRGVAPTAGQVWQRKLDPVTGRPRDSDSADDWAGDLKDLAWGRRVRMPGWLGWDSDELLVPLGGTAHANTTVAVGPEGLFSPLADAFRSAAHTIDLSLYTFEHPALAELLAAAARRGVRVRLLLEGSPPGGIANLQRWCVATIAAAGGDVRYMAVQDGAPKGYAVRYRFLHAKYGIIDGRQAFVGTENLSLDAMPVPNGGPVGGRRGFYLFTDAGPVVAALSRILAADWRPEVFRDLHPYTPDHPRYGGPPADFVLPEPSYWPVAASPFGAAATYSGPAQYAVVSAPENAVRPDTGLHQLLQRAGAGDEVYLVQLYEHRNWGDTASHPVADPNPRLQMLIDAARRGAKVRLLLDAYFDEPEALRSNAATVAYVRALAAAENLDMEARRGNPTLGGIHAKVALVRIGTEHWTAVGSLNGSEVSHKLNREVVLLTDLAGVYQRLQEVFAWDWQLGVPR